ncbi:hypothetical protein HK100_009545 [Physocladia obscura]|uniref:Transmembrane protein n=1 Tax=Physocladia obscura TaxID=109957 RepID=A0AAD5T4X9_9FUNG|nr:hypothetical protein HK100_009545 [Physocladia obscura]
MFRQGRTYRYSTYRKANSERAASHPVQKFLSNFFIGVAIASVPLFLLYVEQSRTTAQDAVNEALSIVVPAYPSTPINSLVFASSHSVNPDLIQDPQFALAFPGAVRVRRNTEYCQWQEFSHDERVTERDEDGNEHTVTTTTFYYNKGWYPLLIQSMFFDQPAAHYNPQRDPYPSITRTAAKAALGEYTVLSSVLQSADEGWKVRSTYSTDEIDAMDQLSDAGVDERFRYIGNGYFYSEYEATHTATFLRAAGMALEGSFLDYQIADLVNGLFGTCAAGDIRVRYEAILVNHERGASVVGKLLPDNKIGVYEMSNGYKMGLFENTADITYEKMFDKVLNQAWWWVFGGYVALVVWASVVTYWYPWKPLEQQRESGSNSKNPLDVYFWAAEAAALTIVTAGTVKLLVTNELTVGLTCLAAGTGVLAVSNSPQIRLQFGEKEKTD